MHPRNCFAGTSHVALVLSNFGRMDQKIGPRPAMDTRLFVSISQRCDFLLFCLCCRRSRLSAFRVPAPLLSHTGCEFCQSCVEQRDPCWVDDPRRSWGIGVSVDCPCHSVEYPQKYFLPWGMDSLCVSLASTAESLCTHPAWMFVCFRGQKNVFYMYIEGVYPGDSGIRTRFGWGQFHVSAIYAIQVNGSYCPRIYKSDYLQLRITILLTKRKIRSTQKIMNRFLTRYLNCMCKSNPVCLIQQWSGVIWLGSYVVWYRKLDPLTFFDQCAHSACMPLCVQTHEMKE